MSILIDIEHTLDILQKEINIESKYIQKELEKQQPSGTVKDNGRLGRLQGLNWMKNVLIKEIPENMTNLEALQIMFPNLDFGTQANDNIIVNKNNSCCTEPSFHLPIEWCNSLHTGGTDIKAIKYAEWEDFRPDNGNKRPRCSNCHEWGYTRWDIKTPYCPYCGKKMKNGIKQFDEESPDVTNRKD